MGHSRTEPERTQLRRISLLRHAKAERDDGAMPDHARALTERGRGDAAALAGVMQAEGWLPELVLCSTATRTRQTLEALELSFTPVILTDRIYQATEAELLDLLREIDDATRHVLMIGHNPGIHALAIHLAHSFDSREQERALPMKFPTCGFVSLSLPALAWREVSAARGHLDRLWLKGEPW